MISSNAFETKTLSFGKRTVGNESKLLCPKRILALPISGKECIVPELFQFRGVKLELLWNYAFQTPNWKSQTVFWTQQNSFGIKHILVIPTWSQKCLVSEFECKIEDGVWLVLQHIFIDSSHNTDWIIMQTESYYVKKTKLTDSLVAGKKAKIIKKCWVLNIGWETLSFTNFFCQTHMSTFLFTHHTMLQKLSKCEVKAWLCRSLIILLPLRFYVKS